MEPIAMVTVVTKITVKIIVITLKSLQIHT